MTTSEPCSTRYSPPWTSKGSPSSWHHDQAASRVTSDGAVCVSRAHPHLAALEMRCRCATQRSQAATVLAQAQRAAAARARDPDSDSAIAEVTTRAPPAVMDSRESFWIAQTLK